MEIFNIEDYKFISEMLETKCSNLRKNKIFNEKYTKLFDLIDSLDNSLSEKQKDKFNEILNLFYETEEYYLVFSYLLGLKYGKDLEKI